MALTKARYGQQKDISVKKSVVKHLTDKKTRQESKKMVRGDYDN